MAKKQTWSYSRYNCYKKCPFLYKLRYIEKLPEPKGPALARGIEIHNEAEDYLLDRVKKLPASLIKLKVEYTDLKKKQPICEENWAVNSNWQETGWKAADTWLRFKIDATFANSPMTMTVIDHKTGKIYDDYDDQLELYATVMFAMYDVEYIFPQLWYIDQGKILDKRENGSTKFHVSEFNGLVQSWEDRVEPMFNDKRFAPTKNWTCRWCHFRKANGGPCKF